MHTLNGKLIDTQEPCYLSYPDWTLLPTYRIVTQLISVKSISDNCTKQKLIFPYCSIIFVGAYCAGPLEAAVNEKKESIPFDGETKNS